MRDYTNADFYYGQERGGSMLNKVLLAVLLALVVILVCGTAVGLVSGTHKKSPQYRRADPSPQKVTHSGKKNQKLDAFTELGQIRAVTKAEEGEEGGILLVVSPWFSYQSGDTALFEELAQKNRQEKAIILNYFGSYTEKELLAKGERNVKEELLSLINEQLVLGKITNVYFDQYLFFE